MPDSAQEFTPSEKEALLGEAIDNWGARIINYLASLCQDRTLAEDLSQKLWIYVYRTFNPWDYGHIGFLERKAHQLWIDTIRHQNRKKRPPLEFVDDLPVREVPSKCPEPQTADEEERLFDHFWEQFRGVNLTRQQKEIFWLHERYGFTMKEVAQKLGIAKSTTHDHLKLAKSCCLDYFNQTEDNA